MKNPRRSKELLVTCPLCGKSGFTARGLQAHWCEVTGKRPLAPSVVRAAIERAEAGRSATGATREGR